MDARARGRLRATALSLLAAAAAPPVTASHESWHVPCIPRDSFMSIDFGGAQLVRSNLGGQGGRCDTAAGGCLEVRGPSTPQEIYYSGVSRASNGASVDLRVTNESECTRPACTTHAHTAPNACAIALSPT